MSSETEIVQPPRVAVSLVNLFTPTEEVEAILGDLIEEFSQLASKSGVPSARKWFWRQTLKTIAHLASAGFRAAPWSTGAAIAAGILLARFGFGWYAQAFNEGLDDLGVYEYIAALGSQHPSINVAGDYMFWINRCRMIGHVLVALLIGGVVASAAKRRELTTAIAMGLLLSGWRAALFFMMVVRAGDIGIPSPWAVSFVLGDSMAIVVGGAIVRMYRSSAATRRSTT